MTDAQTEALLASLNELAMAIRENTQAIVYSANVAAGEYEGDEIGSDAPNGYDLAGRPI